MSRKRGKDKRPAKQAVPEEILAEGSGPNEVVDANAQSLADAASDALGPVADVEVRAEPAKKTTTDAWGQPIEVDESELIEMAPVVSDEPEVAAEVAAAPEPASKKKSKRKGKAKHADTADTADTEAAELQASASDELPADDVDVGVGADAELEASADAESSDAEPTAEAQSEQALEDAVMRAEAEAELGEGESEGEGDDIALEVEGTGAALPTTAASMDAAQLKNLVEALVFAADKPVTLQRLRQLTRVSDVKRLEQALAEIAADYTNRGILLQTVSGGYQFRTNTSYSVWVQQLIAGRPVRLSRAQLETLAIVAYRQPITRPEVDEIRGVDSSATLRLLLDRSLIRVLGKKEDVGRPTLYGTTKEFLDFFSLSDLRELPTLREYSELTAESRKVMSDRLGIEVEAPIMQAPAGGDVVSDEELAEAVMTADGVVDVEAQRAEDDAAAVEAVSAVTEVLGIVDSTSEVEAAMPADEAMLASNSTSELASDEPARASDETSELSLDELAHAADEPIADTSSDESMHASDESTSELAPDEPARASDETSELSSNEAMVASGESSAAELSLDELAHAGDEPIPDTSSDESMHASDESTSELASDEPARASDETSELASDEPARASDESSAAEVSSDEPVHASEETSELSSGESADDELSASEVASDEPAHTGDEPSSNESMLASTTEPSSDEPAHASEEKSELSWDEPVHASEQTSELSSGESTGDELSAAETASDEPAHALSAAETAPDEPTDESAANAGPSADEAASGQSVDAASEDSLDLGAPRGASQEDVIARAHDAAHDPDELADDLPPDRDAADAGHHDVAPDLDVVGDDAGIAGAGGLEADDSENPDGNADAEADGMTNPDILDASAPDSLDETDEPPAD